MGQFVADATIKQMILAGKRVKTAKVVILGVTFKEDCPDTRNSKVHDIIRRLNEYGVTPVLVDPEADPEGAKKECPTPLVPLEAISGADCVILAVAHSEFKALSLKDIDEMFAPMPNSEKVLIDVKSVLNKVEIEAAGYRYWRL